MASNKTKSASYRRNKDYSTYSNGIMNSIVTFIIVIFEQGKIRLLDI